MDFLKRLVPQQIINLFYHLPKAILANIVYGFPTKKLKVIGITGTDGKTTTTNMIYKILKDAEKKVSMISTINAVITGKSYDTGFHVTSPDPFTIQKFARDAVRGGDEYLVLEVTSHAIDQYRVWGINFEVAVITNITHEHLDYHKTFEGYFKTKLSFLKNAKYAVVNENLNRLLRFARNNNNGRVITFGIDEGDFNQEDLKLKLGIPGDYNIENGLAAIAATQVSGIDSKDAALSLETFNNLTGRMEEVKNSLGIKIIIDFAHTPNGLAQALKTLKKNNPGKLIAVFGAASKRDISKRSLMGEAAGKYADLIVLTAEDPRGENVDSICKQIAKGVEKTGKIFNKNYWIVTDRREAIEFVVRKLAKKGDIVGIFGKGHERSMNIDGKKEVAWSDVEEVESILYGR